MGGAAGAEVVDFTDRVRHLAGRDRVRQPPAGDRVRLGQTIDGHGALAHAVQHRDADVLARVNKMLVDFVRDRERVEFLAEAGDERQLVGAVHLAGRVVRVVDDDRAPPRLERLAQLVAVEVPVGRNQRHHHRCGAREDAVRAVVFVERLENNHLVARIDQRQNARQHRLGHAAADGDLRLRVDRHPPEVLGLGRNGLAHHPGAPGGRVLVEIVADGIDGGFFQFAGGGEVGEPLRQVEATVAMRGTAEPRHLPDDRLREQPGLVGDHCARHDTRMPEVSRSTGQDNGVAKFRKQFPIFQQKVYLSSCSQGALSTPVEASLQEFIESWHTHGNPWETWVTRMEELRAEFAQLINASTDEVAVTFSVSTALNSLASALDYRERPGVVTSDFDFPTVGHVWLAQQRRGARVSFAQADGNRLPLSSFEQAVDEHTALVSTTHVCYKNGYKNNVSALAELAHERGAYLLIDAYQSMGTQPMDVKALDLDFLVTGALKYLLGSPGVAFMYVRRELIDRFEPADSGWFGQENVFAYDVHHLRYAGEARRFETGSPPVPNVYAALAALRMIAGVGLATIEEHVRELMSRFILGARQRGLVLLTPEQPADRGPLAMVRSTDAARLVAALARDGILCSTRDGALRESLHYYNTAEDVDAVLSGLDRHPELLVTGTD